MHHKPGYLRYIGASDLLSIFAESTAYTRQARKPEADVIHIKDLSENPHG